jgi:hypothetical protein
MLTVFIAPITARSESFKSMATYVARELSSATNGASLPVDGGGVRAVL